MAAVAAGIGAARSRLERIVADSTLDPADKVRELRAQRDDLLAAARTATDRGTREDYTTLAGQADTYIGEQELRREAAALGVAKGKVLARENADVRERVLARGLASGTELDAAGVLSHDVLDEHVEDGTMEEAVLPLIRERGS